MIFKTLSKLLILFIGIIFLVSCKEKENKTKPNILIIISDDQGYGDFGFTGNTLANTPVLDELSREGAFYTNFMVAPACSPTRSAMLTGRNHLDVGVWGVGSRGNVRRDEVLMPSFFNPSGYQTWVIGKLDGTFIMELDATDRGFDWYCGIGGGYLHKDPIIVSPSKPEQTKGWSAEIITDIAIKRIKEAGNNPWLLHLAYIIPHEPWHCPDDYADPYRTKGLSESLSQCYGSIKQMDDQIGRLLDAVGEAGQEENTIVLFLSDNGPTETIPAWVNNNFKNAQNSEDWKLRNACDLIGHKAEVWENGIRSPLLVRWPGKIKPGVREHVTKVEDILPTLLDLADISDEKLPEHLPFDGKSFRASLEDPSYVKSNDIFRIALAGPGAPDWTAKNGIIPDARELDYDNLHTVLRTGNYKFHHLPGGIQRLYDMDADPGEKKDLSKNMPELTNAMAQRCRSRWDDIASRNRTFTMQQLRINNADRPHKAWSIPVLQPLCLEGELRVHPWLGGVKGFRSPGDHADYIIELQKPLSGYFVAEGTGFNDIAPINLMVDGEIVAAKSRSEDKIIFSLMEMPAGNVSISLVVDDAAEPTAAIGEVMKLTLINRKFKL